MGKEVSLGFLDPRGARCCHCWRRCRGHEVLNLIHPPPHTLTHAKTNFVVSPGSMPPLAHSTGPRPHQARTRTLPHFLCTQARPAHQDQVPHSLTFRACPDSPSTFNQNGLSLFIILHLDSDSMFSFAFAFFLRFLSLAMNNHSMYHL